MFYVRALVIFVWIVVCSVLSFAAVLYDRRSMNRLYGRLFSRVIQRVCGIRVLIEGLEHLGPQGDGEGAPGPRVYVANHQSGLDIMLFGSFYPRRTLLIGKKEILFVPFFNLFYVAGGNVLIDRAKRVQAISSLSKAVRVMREKGASIWIFPEGTRNRTDGSIQSFKKGGFYMAIQAGVPIVPVVAGSMAGLVSWRGRFIRPGTLRVRILAPVSTEGLSEADVESLMERVRAQMVLAHAEISR